LRSDHRELLVENGLDGFPEETREWYRRYSREAPFGFGAPSAASSRCLEKGGRGLLTGQPFVKRSPELAALEILETALSASEAALLASYAELYNGALYDDPQADNSFSAGT